MKPKFFIFGLCALGLAACSLDEVVRVNDTDSEVQFKVTLGHSTRAAATTSNNISSFSVWAWNTVDGVTNEFMDDAIATRNGDVFSTTPLYFWPTGTVDFYAISPSTTVTAIEGGTEYAYIGGTMDKGGDYWEYKGNVARATITGENGKITIEADLPGRAGEHIDLCYAVTTGRSGSPVPMNFRHAFSQLVFKAINTNSELTIDIDSVSVCSVNKHGVYTLPTTSTTSNLNTSDIGTDGISESQGTWNVTDGTRTRFAAGINHTTLEGISSEAVKLTAEEDSNYGYLFMVPQTVAAWDPETDKTDEALGAYLRVCCRVTEDGSVLWPNANETGNTTTGSDGYEYADIAVPVDVEWKEGYRYTYTLIFGDGLGYYAPDDPNSDLDGTPVLVPITFTVTVDEFQDADGVDVETSTPDDDPNGEILPNSIGGVAGDLGEIVW